MLNTCIIFFFLAIIQVLEQTTCLGNQFSLYCDVKHCFWEKIILRTILIFYVWGRCSWGKLGYTYGKKSRKQSAGMGTQNSMSFTSYPVLPLILWWAKLGTHCPHEQESWLHCQAAVSVNCSQMKTWFRFLPLNQLLFVQLGFQISDFLADPTPTSIRTCQTVIHKHWNHFWKLQRLLSIWKSKLTKRTTITHKCLFTRVKKKSLAKNFIMYLLMYIFIAFTNDIEKEKKF